MLEAKQGFAATLRAQAYANIGQIAIVIPVVGWVLAIFWVWCLEVIATREVHQTTSMNAFVAASAFRVVACGLSCVLGIVARALIA